ncbi:MAG TPA: hypothetical protein VG755_37825 [Nannocystaceae bacterium]|nr:hypothetical protein [Nannocystaceae bacterium]
MSLDLPTLPHDLVHPSEKDDAMVSARARVREKAEYRATKVSASAIAIQRNCRELRRAPSRMLCSP